VTTGRLSAFAEIQAACLYFGSDFALRLRESP